MGTESLFREQSGRGVALTAHPHLAPRLKKEQRLISTTLLGIHGFFYGEIYLLLRYELK
jgi:hypothetical protein